MLPSKNFQKSIWFFAALHLNQKFELDMFYKLSAILLIVNSQNEFRTTAIFDAKNVYLS
jgi:hypothetical protein